MINTDQKIERIRQSMKKHKIAAVIIPSDDPHKSEYVAEYWQVRKWLTGFSGSAGTAVVTLDTAILWTDFRYYIQAQEQIADSDFVLFKTGKPDVPDVPRWLKENLTSGDIVGVDASVFSMESMKKLKTGLESKGLILDTNVDFISDLWTDRPTIPKSKAFLFPEKYAGQSRKDKISQIRKRMVELNATCHLMTTLDDIAWTLNLRGSDVHTNPVNICFLLIDAQKISLFMAHKKADETIRTEFGNEKIDIYAYEQIQKTLLELPDNAAILIDPENINYQLYQSINKKCKLIEKSNPAIGLKAIKNDVQISHMHQTAVKDGVAVTNFLFWLEQQNDSDNISEQSVADVLYAFRKEQELFIDNSFDPIMAWQDHSAMCHYSATSQSDVAIGSNGMFLTDSGGNYLSGTTDITRTVYRGVPTQQAIIDYTLVLKGHIAVATTLFPKGTKGFQIDTLARQYLWNQGLDFGHGTGHGVGFFLCVHEGPARISPHPTDVKLEKGMLLTNEPGIYRDGGYGIRLENMILVVQAFENEFGEFFKFENLTYCHLEKNLMDKKMLSKKEIDYIDTYHAKVYDKLHRYLKLNVAEWLRKKTGPL